MTGHPLDDPTTIRSHELPCTWTTGNGDTIPAVLTTSRTDNGWWVCVTPDGWATLWLSKDEAAPWGPWRTSSATSRDHAYPTAEAAVDAAMATDQIGVA